MRQWKLVLLVSAVCSLLAPVSGFPASLGLYDNFSGTQIDGAKWQNLEIVREIRDGRLVLKYRAAGPPGWPTTNLQFVNPTAIQSFQADIRMNAFEKPDGGLSRLGLHGTYYNDGTGGPGSAGDVSAQLYLTGNASGDGADVRYSVYKCTDTDCSMTVTVIPTTTIKSVNLDEVHTLAMAWDGAVFAFSVDGGDTVVDPRPIQPVVIATPNLPEKVVRAQLGFVGAGGEGSVAGDFDNIYVNGALYDDFDGTPFSGPRLDSAKWADLEFVREIQGGKFESRAAWIGAAGSSQRNRSRFANQNLVTAVQADVTVTAFQSSNNTFVKAQVLGGSFYNDGASTGGSDFTGDVQASMRVFSSNGAPPTIHFWAGRCNDSVCSALTGLLDDPIAPVNLGATHTLFLIWDGPVFTYGIKDLGIIRTFDPKPGHPVAKPPASHYKDMGTGVGIYSEDAYGYIAATFDNVYVNDEALTLPRLAPSFKQAVNVAADTPASVTNSASVPGGGEPNTANKTATDPTTVLSSICAPPPAGLVSWWKGEGNAIDEAGLNNGTLMNGTGLMPGMVGQAFSLDGVNDYVNVPNSPSLDPTAAASIAAWVSFDQLPSAAGHFMQIAAKSGGGTDLDLQAQTDNRVYFYVAGGRNVRSNTVVQTGMWYHIIATYTANNQLKMYVNGVLENSVSIVGTTRGTNSNPFTIGESGVWRGRYFKGRIDEVSLFNRALSDSEIQVIYNAGSAGFCQTVTVTATDPAATEAGPTTGTFTFTRTGGTATALTVAYTVSGTATPGSDYVPLGTSVTFPIGAITVTRTVTPLQDTLMELNETVSVALVPSATYAVGTPSNATVTITSDEAVTQTVSVRATDALATEAGPTTGAFTFTRTGIAAALAGAVTVTYTVTGTATAGVDYVSLGTSVVFPAGATTVTKTVTPLQDALMELNETAVLALVQSPTYAVGAASSATVTITSDEAVTQTVSVRATDALATEAGPTTGAFTFTRTGIAAALAGALTVSYTVTGTATAGVDYVSLGMSVTFPARATTVTKTVTPLQDVLQELNETAVLALVQSPTYAVGAASSATVTITSDEPVTQTVTVTSTDPTATEAGPTTGAFTFTRTGSTAAALTVAYTVSGTATPGSDYVPLGTSVTFPIGATTVTRTVTPLQDTLMELNETVSVTLVPSATYAVGSPSSAAVTITSDEPVTQTITVRATDPTATEAGPTTGTFTFTRTGSTAAALTVAYTVSGTAISGSDYIPLGTSVTFPAGQNIVTKTVTPLQDAVVEGNETIVVTLAASAAYAVGTPASATVVLTSDDVASPNVLGTYVGTGSQTLRQCQDPASNISVNFNATIRITSQTGSAFSGSGILTANVGGTAYASTLSSLLGTVNAAGQLTNGSYTFVTTAGGAFDSSGTGTFTGTLVGNRITVNFVSHDQVGDTCVVTGSLTATR